MKKREYLMRERQRASKPKGPEIQVDEVIEAYSVKLGENGEATWYSQMLHFLDITKGGQSTILGLEDTLAVRHLLNAVIQSPRPARRDHQRPPLKRRGMRPR